MLTIGVDARSLLCREPRGEGKSLLRLYEEILRLHGELKVWFFGDSKADQFRGDLPSGVQVDATPSWGHRVNGWENVNLPWRAWRLGCDVLHCASSGAPRLSAVPVVMTVHDLIPLVFPDGQNKQLKASFAHRLDHGLSIARRIITVSEHTKKDLLARAPGIEHRVEVIHWGADDSASDKPLPVPAVPPYLLAFGGESRRKNTSYVIDQFSAMASKVSDMRLKLVGITAPRQREKLCLQLAQAGLSDRVDMPGFVDEAELQMLFRGATVVLYPSLYEGFGLPVLEAIGHGVPVLASDCSSLPEIFGNAPGATCLLPSDTFQTNLQLLAIDSTFRARWVERQRAELIRFQWPEVARKTLECLHATART